MLSRSSEPAAEHQGSTIEQGPALLRYLSYALAGLLLAGSLALAVATYRSVSRELTQAAMSRNAALAHLAAATLAERLERVVDLAVSLATRVRFAELVAEGRWLAAGEVLRGVPGTFPFVERLFLTDAGGTLKVDMPELAAVRERNFAFRDWFRGVSREWRPYVSPVYRRTAEPQHNVIAVAAPVRTRSGGAVAGVLVLQLSLEEFFDWSTAIELDAHTSLIIVDPQGQAAYASGVPWQSPVADLSGTVAVARLQQGRAGAELVREAASAAGWLYAFDPAGHGWGVIVRQPTSAAFAARDQQLRLVQIAFALFALLIATLGWIGRRAAALRREQLARARSAVERHEERLRILGEIDRAVAAEKPADEIAAAVIEPLRRVLQVPRAIVNRFDLAAHEAEWVAAAGRRRARVGPGVRYSMDLMGDVEALGRGEPQRIDVGALARSGETEALLASGVRYYRVVPMIAGGELLGAISFGGGADEFPAEQVAIAQEVATQLAIATAQARLLERVRRHADELEGRVRARTAELEAANRELEAFSYSVSHDLRAPLRAVDGFARMLEEDHGARLGDEGRRLLQVVRESSRAMARLIDDLLAFSRLGREPVSRQPVAMEELVRAVVEEARRDWPGDIEIGALPAAHADPRLLRQAWHNLVDNAFKYSGRRERPRVQVAGKSVDGEDVYWVRDNGVGFDMRYADKLFRVFQRLHGADEFPGTGVGLAIVQRVVGRHGGRVWAEGTPDEGACFYFSLPREA